jgi:hypothetical protein
LQERAKKGEERYIQSAGVANRDVNAAAVRRDHDGDRAAIPTVEQTHE